MQAMIDDQRLVAAVGRGDERAGEELCRRHRGDVYRAALAMLGSTHDADDVAQTTLVRALAAMRRRPPRDLRPWLLTIARNESVSLMRRRPGHAALDAAEVSTCSAAQSALARADARQLLEDMRALPERQRAALVLRELHELDYADVAGRLGVSEGAARQAVLKARASLREREAGRELPCSTVQALLRSDRRQARSRAVRAHMAACAECRPASRLALLAPEWLVVASARLFAAPWGSARSPGLIAVAAAVAVGGIQMAPSPFSHERPEGRAGAGLSASVQPNVRDVRAAGSAARRSRPALAETRRDVRTRLVRQAAPPPAGTAPPPPGAAASEPPAPAAPARSPAHAAKPAAPPAPSDDTTQRVDVLGHEAEMHQEGAPDAEVYAEPERGHIHVQDEDGDDDDELIPGVAQGDELP
jgi:RNA polymerase sigma factor (sigma-70 family)